MSLAVAVSFSRLSLKLILGSLTVITETIGSKHDGPITCQLGTSQCRSEMRHRVVIFCDFEGREIRVVTDLIGITAEQVAQIYKARWQIEVFFRWIKQHLNIPTLFGTTENAVYGQLFSALLVFVLLKWLFDGAKDTLPRHAELSFVQFTRLQLLDGLPVEWMLHIHRMIKYEYR